MRIKRLRLYLVLSLLFLSGCKGESGKEGETDAFALYYVNEEKTKVVSKEVYLDHSDPDSMAKELIDRLFHQPVGEEEQYLLPANVVLLDYDLEEGVLWLNFNQEYQNLDRTQEVLIRASVVRTCVQIPDAAYVGILIEGEGLLNSYGEEIGLLDADSFVENSGKEINTYQHAHMTLYFANESGDGLVKEERSVYYSTSMPLERVIVEQLLKGPKENGHYPTIPPETKILGVTVADGVCYVNLNNVFSDMALNQQEEIPIYSIVNSLVDSGSVTQVQISINGDTKLMYREHLSLDQFFRANPDMAIEEGEDE